MDLRNGRKIMTIPRVKKTNTRKFPLEVRIGGLIPGIPDDITLGHITPKVPWRDIRVLSLVNRGWFQVMDVYTSRVRRNLAETFVLVTRMAPEEISDFSLCSVRDPFCHALPRFQEESCYKKPSEDLRFLFLDQFLILDGENQFLILDGKVYALVCGGNLYLLDLAGRPQWKKCASMRSGTHSRPRCESAVRNGKIYVFGYGVNGQDTRGTMVYNPKRDIWSRKQPIPPMHGWYKVAAFGDEFVCYVPFAEDDDLEDFDEDMDDVDREDLNNVLYFYHPVKNEWRAVVSFERPQQSLSVSRGKFYSISLSDAYVCDFHGCSWAHLHSFSFSSPATESVAVMAHNELETVLTVLVLGNILLAHVRWPRICPKSSCLLLSRGFGGQQKELVWEKVESFFPWNRLSSTQVVKSSLVLDTPDRVVPH
ncbi:unnamed protein product [Calypogeia fissa]